MLNLVLTISCSGLPQDLDGELHLNSPELSEITNWINSDGFTIESKKGKVILVDFFTYTCVNCIRTYPYIKNGIKNMSLWVW